MVEAKATKKGGFMISLLATVLIGVSVAHADIDVSCANGDCLVNGWTTTDLITRQQTVSICVNQDCENIGWITEHNGREVVRTDCKSGGCFNSGWRDFDPRYGNLLADVQCTRSYLTTDCLTNGWTTHIPGRPQTITRCVNGDCHNNGWDVFTRGYQPQPVRCKQGGCFTEGWRIRR